MAFADDLEVLLRYDLVSGNSYSMAATKTDAFLGLCECSPCPAIDPTQGCAMW